MEEIAKIIVSLAPVLILLLPMIFSRTKTALDNRAKTVETAKQAFGLYEKMVERVEAQDVRLALYEDHMATMRTQINQQSDTLLKNVDEIKELNAASVRHSNELADANEATTNYKARYDETKTGLDECRSSCQQQAAAIRKLEAVLTLHHLLTPEIALDIEATLNPSTEPPAVSAAIDETKEDKPKE